MAEVTTICTVCCQTVPRALLESRLVSELVRNLMFEIFPDDFIHIRVEVRVDVTSQDLDRLLDDIFALEERWNTGLAVWHRYLERHIPGRRVQELLIVDCHVSTSVRHGLLLLTCGRAGLQRCLITTGFHPSLMGLVHR